MVKGILFLLLGLTVPATHVRAVEISLPDLIGDYDSGLVAPDDAPRIRTTELQIPSEVQSIASFHISMSGSRGNGFITCVRDIGGGETWTDTLGTFTPVRWQITAAPLGPNCFFGQNYFIEPEFTDFAAPVWTCEPEPELDPDQLLGTMLQISVEVNWDGCASGYIGPGEDARVTLTDVKLVIDTAPLPTRSRTWGILKAGHRSR